MRREIRLLVLGDEHVGKTALITSLLSEAFSEEVPHVLDDITIPPIVSPDMVGTVIVDSSARPEDRPLLEEKVRASQVICLVYAADDAQSFARISSYWLPYIRSLGANVPVILVGNKIDVRGEDVSNEKFEDEIIPIMNDFKEVETCVECSAKTLTNVAEVFYFAQKAVIHPTTPLYDSREQALKPLCTKALCRIFALCDANKDGVIDDDELDSFQKRCFGTPLQAAELEGLKEILREASTQGLRGDAITEAGFLYLHQLFIQRGRIETTWAVLREFNYDDDLSLSDSFLHPPFSVPSGCTVELSPIGHQFLAELFAKHDKNRDGALSTEELKELFNTSPGNPWAKYAFPDSTLVNESGFVTLQGFLAQWSMTTLLDYKTSLEYLAFLGFPGDTRSGLRAMPGMQPNRRKDRAKRDVFSCLVIGATGCGKVGQTTRRSQPAISSNTQSHLHRRPSCDRSSTGPLAAASTCRQKSVPTP